MRATGDRSFLRSVVPGVAVLTLAAAAWLVYAALPTQAPAPPAPPRPVVIEFDAFNGELGELPAEVRVDEANPVAATATCEVGKGTEMHLCRVQVSLPRGRRMVSLRMRIGKAWTPWSEATLLQVD